MVLVACLTLPLAWVANHARTQGLALSAISHGGGFVIYGFQRSPDGIIVVGGTPDPAPDWLRRYVPEHYISPTWTSSSSSRSTKPGSVTAGWSTCGRMSGSSP
jgi:hypothetical protein